MSHFHACAPDEPRTSNQCCRVIQAQACVSKTIHLHHDTLCTGSGSSLFVRVGGNSSQTFCSFWQAIIRGAWGRNHGRRGLGKTSVRTAMSESDRVWNAIHHRAARHQQNSFTRPQRERNHRLWQGKDSTGKEPTKWMATETKRSGEPRRGRRRHGRRAHDRQWHRFDHDRCFEVTESQDQASKIQRAFDLAQNET